MHPHKTHKAKSNKLKKKHEKEFKMAYEILISTKCVYVFGIQSEARCGKTQSASLISFYQSLAKRKCMIYKHEQQNKNNVS